MRFEGETLVVREAGEYFRLAAEGLKPNHIFTANPTLNAEMRERRYGLQRIMVYNEFGDEFDRYVSDITCIAQFLGTYVWIVSWYHDGTEVRKGVGKPRLGDPPR